MLDLLRLTWFLCCVALISKQPADAQQTALATLLQANRYELHGAGWGDEQSKYFPSYVAQQLKPGFPLFIYQCFSGFNYIALVLKSRIRVLTPAEVTPEVCPRFKCSPTG